MMRLLVAFSIFISPLLSVAQMTDFTRQELSYVNVLAPLNGGFESGTAKWTASGGTFAAVTAGSNLLEGKGSTTWNSNSASQTLTSQAVTVKNGYFGRNCEASIVAQVPSGTATHTFQAWDGTNPLAFATIESSTLPRKNTLTFPCPSSGTYAIRILSVASDEPLIALDEGYLGLARNVGVADLITEPRDYTPSLTTTGGGSITLNATGKTDPNGKWWQEGSFMVGAISFRNGSGGAASGAAGSVRLSIPSGYTIDTARMVTQVGGIRVDGDGDIGTTTFTSVNLYADSTTTFVIMPTGGSSYLQVSSLAANYIVSIRFKVPIVGWAASTVVMPDAQGWFASASITGANANITGSSSAWQETTNASLTMVQNPGSATVGIPCASGTTNSQGALTCASANESFGIDVNIPKSGSYEVCAQGAVGFNDSGSGTNFNAEITFAVIQTTAGSSAPVVEGPGRSNAKYASNSAGGGEVLAVHYPFNSCSVFSLSAGRNTFRLENENLVSGTGSIAMMADGDASIGAKSVTFTVKPVSQQQQAILANSVSTGVTNGLKIESAKLTTTTGPNACAITSQFGTWITGTPSSSGAGQCSFTIASGVFSSAPNCDFDVFAGGSAISATGNASSATAGTFQIWDAAGAGTTGGVVATCVGPR